MTAIQESTDHEVRTARHKPRREGEVSRRRGLGSGSASASVAVGLDEATRTHLYRQSRRGVSVEVLAVQSGLGRAQVVRAVNEMRARRILESKLEFMPDPGFEDPAAVAEILGPTPEPAAGQGEGTRRPRAPEDLPPYLESLYHVPLLSREQERHLFRKMNYLKYRAHQLREALDPERCRTADLDRIERLQEEALAVKNQIIRANLRLVVSIAKKHVGPANNFFELISDGNMSLIRAVEKFDASRGFKFSTYASWAIMKNFTRSIPEEKHRRDRFVTGHDEMFASAPDTRSDVFEQETGHRRSQEIVQGMLGRLNDRERHILISRYGIGGADEQTLEQLGRHFGVTKERVRQIESRAQEKLRQFALEERFDLGLD
jgi:RNA polymerase primary sigma factor